MRAFGEHKDRRTATDGDPVSCGWKGTKTALPSGQNGNSRLSLKFVHAQTGLNAHGHGYTLLMAAGTHGGAAESKTTRARARARTGDDERTADDDEAAGLAPAAGSRPIG
jgi:hypothetical protein